MNQGLKLDLALSLHFYSIGPHKYMSFMTFDDLA